MFLFTSRVLQYGNRWHSQRSMKFILVTKEIRLFHLKVLLISLNICSGCRHELENGIGSIYYIVLSETRKKLSCYNENIQHCCFKKLRCNIKKKLKFNGANNCIHLPFVRQFYEFIALLQFYEKNSNTSRGKLWWHYCLHKKLAILCLHEYGLTLAPACFRSLDRPLHSGQCFCEAMNWNTEGEPVFF